MFLLYSYVLLQLPAHRNVPLLLQYSPPLSHFSPSLHFPLSHPLNSVQTLVLNLDSLCLTKHMECYCSGMLLVWVVFSVCACVRVYAHITNHAHALKQMRAPRMMMIMIMVRVCLCVPVSPQRTEWSLLLSWPNTACLLMHESIAKPTNASHI